MPPDSGANTISEVMSRPGASQDVAPIPAPIDSPDQGSRRIKDKPTDERPREKLQHRGPDSLNNAELIAILLRTGLKGRNAVEIGEQVLTRFGSLTAMAKATVADLRTIKGIGRDKAVTLIAAFSLARKMADELRRDAPLLDNPESVAALMREDLRVREVETFYVLHLNTRRRLIGMTKISDGTLDTILVHPREVFKPAISASAAAIVLVHNHPSGDPSPSEADIKVTRDLIRAGQLLKVEVLDHVIIGARTDRQARDYVSLRELGYFYS